MQGVLNAVPTALLIMLRSALRASLRRVCTFGAFGTSLEKYTPPQTRQGVYVTHTHLGLVCK